MTADLIPDPSDYDHALDNPRGHRYTPDPLSFEGDCIVCGTHCDPFGLRDEPAFPDVPQEIPVCPSCTHYRHDRECGVLVSRWPEKSCPCSERAA